MKKNQPSKARHQRGFVALMAVVIATSVATPAFAEVTKVSGVDYLYPGIDSYEEPVTTEDGFVDLLSVTGDEGDILYVDLQNAAGAKVASHMPFVLDETTLIGDDTGSGYICMLSLDTSQLPTDTTYTISVYTDRSESNLVYTGTVSFIFGQFGEGGPVKPIVVRTAAEGEERGCPAPDMVNFSATEGDATQLYKLESTEPTTIDGKTVYLYKLASEAPAQVTGHVSYYLVGGTDAIRVDEIPNIQKGTTRDVEIPEIVGTDAGYFRTVQVGNKIQLGYPGTTEASIYCLELKSPTSWGDMGEPYKASIYYVDTDSSEIMTDSLYVTRNYTYTAPSRIYKTDASGNVLEYVLESDPTLTFEPGAPEASRERVLTYRLVTDASELTWTVKCIDADSGIGGTPIPSGQKTIKIDDLNVDSEGNLIYVPVETLEGGKFHAVQNMIKVNPNGGEIVAYYTSTDSSSKADYNVTVRYVNIAATDGSVLDTSTEVITYDWADKGLDQAILVPESLQGGQYVLIPGQLFDAADQAGYLNLYHSYYAGARTYTIYYRDINDPLNATTVISRIRTVYDDVIVTDLGTTTTAATTTPAAAATTEAAAAAAAPTAPTATTLDDQGGLNAVTGGGANTIVRDDGTTTSEERITDDTTPLAGPEGTNAAQATLLSPTAKAGLVGGIAGFGALLGLFFARKVKKDKDQSLS